MSTQAPEIDAATLRTVLGHYPTGVVIVTGNHPDGERLAMIVGTFTSVSLDPPLVAFLPMKTSKTFQRLQECTTMCVNVLTGDQEELGRTIASRWENKFDGVECISSTAGNPVFAESLAWLDVTLEQSIEAGDHLIVLCRITDLAVHNPTNPLIFFQGGYGRFVTPSLVARIDSEIISEVQDAVIAREDIEQLAQQIGCECSLLTALNRDELAALVSAAAPGINPEPSLGARMPIVPPIGDTVVSAQSEQDQEYWLNKAKGCEDEKLQVFRDRLEFCREHGYLASFLPEGAGATAYESMREATSSFARGKLTPANERSMRALISSSAVEYDVRPIEPGTRYDIGSIVVPVKDAKGEVTLTLRLGQLPGQVDGATVLEWIALLKQAGQRIEARLAARGSIGS